MIEASRPPRSFFLPLVFGSLGVVLLLLVVLIFWLRRDGVPRFSRADFDRAWELWQSVEPPAYRISIRVVGPQPATYAVEVRDGEVQRATRNGNPLTQQRTMGTWSVPGMFDTMEYDLNAVHASGDEPAGSTALSLRAEFAPDYGYPRRYLRSDATMGTTTYWQVESFQVLGQDVPPLSSASHHAARKDMP